MKKSTLKQVIALVAVVAALVIIASCRKNSGNTDLVIVPPKVPGERVLSVSVLNSTDQDSLSGYSLHIKSPSGETDKTVSGTRYVITNPEAGIYTFTATLNGFLAASKSVIVILPVDETVGLAMKTSLMLTKSAPPVAITAATGGTIAVKEEAGAPAAPVVATVTVPASTTFTLADGSQPASVAIAVTNVPTAAETAPVVTVNGQDQVALKEIELVNNAVSLKKLDLQPEGMTFSKPMLVSMYVGDAFAGMTTAQKTAEQAYLFFNYEKTDGSVEQVAPDHFSANRDTVFFKISHFSNWEAVLKKYDVQTSTIWRSTSQSTGCGGSLDKISYTVTYDYTKNTFNELLGYLNIKKDLVAILEKQVDVQSAPGYSTTVNLEVELTRYVVTNKKTGERITIDLFTGNIRTSTTTGVCHNQGGGH